MDKEHKTTSPTNDPETSEPLHKQKPTVMAGQKTDTTTQQQKPLSVSSKPPTPDSPLSPVTNSENVPPQSPQLDELQSKTTEAPTKQQKQLITGDAKPQTKATQPQVAQVQPETVQPMQTLRSPPSVSRPVPLLAAKPYCQPRNTPSGHKPFKVSTRDSKTSRSTSMPELLHNPVLNVGYLNIFTSYSELFALCVQFDWVLNIIRLSQRLKVSTSSKRRNTCLSICKSGK